MPKPLDLDPSFDGETNAIRIVAGPTDPVATEPLDDVAPRFSGFPTQIIQNLIETRTSRLKAQDGTELDMKTGLPPGIRFGLSWRDSPEDQQRFLEAHYGPGKARYVDGEWVVRVPDAVNQKETDVLAVPDDYSFGSFGELPRFVFDVAAGEVGERGAARIPWLGRLRGLLGIGRRALGQGAGVGMSGAALDVAARAHDEVPWNLPDIFLRRGAEGLATTAIGVPLLSATTALQWARSPLAGQTGEVEVNLRKAIQHFKDRTGIDIEVEPALLTGDESLVARHRFGRKLPFAAEYVTSRETNRKAIRERVLDIIVGAQPSDMEELARAFSYKIKTGIDPYREAVEAAEKRHADAAAAMGEVEAAKLAPSARGLARTINQRIGELTTHDMLIDPQMVAELNRSKLLLMRSQAVQRNSALYQRFEDAGGREAMVDMEPYAARAKALYDDLPQELKVNADSGVVEATGGVASEFVPERNVINRLRQLMVGGERRFHDLQQMRTEVWDDISKAGVFPSLGVGYQKQIAGLLTDAMDNGLKGLPGDLDKLAKDAAEDYAKNVAIFDKKGIKEAFDLDDIGPNELITKYLKGPTSRDRYNTLKGFVGETSTEFRMLKRAIADDRIQPALLEGGDLVNLEKYGKQIESFAINEPHLAADVFGGFHNAAELRRMGVALQEYAGKKVPDKTANDFLTGKISSAELKEVMAAQDALDEQVRGHILSSFKTGKLPSNITHLDILNRFYDTAQPEELRKLMAIVADDDEMTRKLRVGLMTKLMRTDPSEGATLEWIIHAEKNKRAREILNPQMFEDLKQWSHIESPYVKAKKVGDSAGTMARGAVLGGVMADWIGTGSKLVKNLAVSVMLDNDQLRKWFMRDMGTHGAASTVADGTIALMSSVPFMEGMMEQLGDETKLGNAYKNMKHSLADFTQRVFDKNYKDAQSRERLNREIRKRKPLDFGEPLQ